MGQCGWPYLLDERPLVPPLVQAAAGQRVDGLGSARLARVHLLVQEVLKGELLVFVVYVVHHLQLREEIIMERRERRRGHASADPGR